MGNFVNFWQFFCLSIYISTNIEPFLFFYCISYQIYYVRFCIYRLSRRRKYPSACLIILAAIGTLPVSPQHTRLEVFAINPSVHFKIPGVHFPEDHSQFWLLRFKHP